jgi:hypothetical protein
MQFVDEKKQRAQIEQLWKDFLQDALEIGYTPKLSKIEFHNLYFQENVNSHLVRIKVKPPVAVLKEIYREQTRLTKGRRK